MTNNQNQSRNMVPRSGGFFKELTNRFRLIGRLMMDSRVNPLVKLLPVASLAYAIWPLDLPTPIDDAVVLWVGTTLFVELCPPAVVEEHLKSFAPQLGDEWKGSVPPTANTANQDIVDGVYYEKDPNAPDQRNNP